MKNDPFKVSVIYMKVGFDGISLPKVDEKSLFTREFLWWLADGSRGVVRCSVESLGVNQSLARIHAQVEFNSLESRSEFELTWGPNPAQNITSPMEHWTYDDGERIW